MAVHRHSPSNLMELEKSCKEEREKLPKNRRMVFMVFKEGHLVWACPERQSDPGVSERPGQEAAEPAVVVPPAATVRTAAESPGVAAAPEQTESKPPSPACCPKTHWSYVNPRRALRG
ncbi:hypothetical protein QTP86_008385 [Hemibagrus guttatus]|nr:hypothetical protein QTP86_008385 [Hemibagrus guttatus]